MDFENAQKAIASILSMLKEAKESAALGPNDPAVVELERIMIRKVGEIEAAETEARDELSFENLFFAPNDLDEAEAPALSSIDRSDLASSSTSR